MYPKAPRVAAPRPSPLRLYLLYANLGFPLEEIAEMTGYPLSAVRRAVRANGLRKWKGVLPRLQIDQMSAVATILGDHWLALHILHDERDRRPSDIVAETRDTVTIRAREKRLDWDVFDALALLLKSYDRDAKPEEWALHRGHLA